MAKTEGEESGVEAEWGVKHRFLLVSRACSMEHAIPSLTPPFSFPSSCSAHKVRPVVKSFELIMHVGVLKLSILPVHEGELKNR